MNTQHSARGFTILELLLYVSIAGVILLGVSVFLSALLGARVKNQTIAEVDSQGMQVLQLITQTLRNADSINTPAQGGVSTSLSLNTYTGGLNPTVFDLAGGVLRVSEGAGAAVPLTNSRVTVSSLSVQNLTRTGAPGVVRVMFTLSYNNTSGRPEFTYQKNFIVTGALRQP